jgi:hypothetical protein
MMIAAIAILRPRVRAVAKNAFDGPGIIVAPGAAAITVLNVGGMNDNVQHETQRVDQDVSLETLDLLARVVARRIKPRPVALFAGTKASDSLL